ncbi:hypothetical protein ES705_09390 [subsurface metagenome]
MPEFKCQNCGRHFFGWGVKGICRVCGSKLVPANETAKSRVK